MKLEIEVSDSNPNAKRAYIVPSHEGGCFVFDANYHGVRTVGKICLVGGVTEEAIDLMESGALGVDKLFATSDTDDTLVFPVGIPDHVMGNLETTIAIHGSNNSVCVPVPEFREFAPVDRPNH